MAIDWNEVIQSQKFLQRNMKNAKGMNAFFSKKPQKGYMVDNKTENAVEIAKCRSSTLRRYVKLLKSYYRLTQDPEQRKMISDKLAEVEIELYKRPDAEGTVK